MNRAGRVMTAGRAVFDATGAYRYRLCRTWDATGRRVVFVMLNPSTADATRDDPTIRRCVGFARRWGFGFMEVVNLFALRATRPADLWRAADPVGPRNDQYLRRAAARADLLVIAWGVHGRRHGRHEEVLAMLARERPAYCLGVTASGCPRHPLYIAANRRPQTFRFA